MLLLIFKVTVVCVGLRRLSRPRPRPRPRPKSRAFNALYMTDKERVVSVIYTEGVKGHASLCLGVCGAQVCCHLLQVKCQLVDAMC